ncbi:MAG TPA: hypothetical protein VE326_11445 [Candidatus Binatia bacterium]|nr:hypothetical protein [Candidatus Binatia bacterium]
MVVAALWPAYAVASEGVDLGALAQYGAVGLIAAGGIWFAKGTVQRERERADRLEDDNKRLNALIVDRVIPALNSATNAAEESGRLLNAMQREREVRAEVARRRAAPIDPEVL